GVLPGLPASDRPRRGPRHCPFRNDEHPHLPPVRPRDGRPFVGCAALHRAGVGPVRSGGRDRTRTADGRKHSAPVRGPLGGPPRDRRARRHHRHRRTRARRRGDEHRHHPLPLRDPVPAGPSLPGPAAAGPRGLGGRLAAALPRRGLPSAPLDRGDAQSALARRESGLGALPRAGDTAGRCLRHRVLPGAAVAELSPHRRGDRTPRPRPAGRPGRVDPRRGRGGRCGEGCQRLPARPRRRPGRPAFDAGRNALPPRGDASGGDRGPQPDRVVVVAGRQHPAFRDALRPAAHGRDRLRGDGGLPAGHPPLPAAAPSALGAGSDDPDPVFAPHLRHELGRSAGTHARSRPGVLVPGGGCGGARHPVPADPRPRPPRADRLGRRAGRPERRAPRTAPGPAL
ncbi:MAG: hypothetical protein AVDCRST_MAG83-3703, partial [uncultured Arthrobacter sp.]